MQTATHDSTQHPPRLRVRVADIEHLGPQLRAFTLITPDGGELPPFTAGSHVFVSAACGHDSAAKPYSLTSCPDDRDRYQIVVGRSGASNGMSRYLHEQVDVGSELEISAPLPGIELAPDAVKHVLIAGGVGVTPFLSHLTVLRGAGIAYELHYCHDDDSLLTRLRNLPAGVLFSYPSGHAPRLDVGRLIAAQPPGAHVYVCGPRGLIEDTVAAAWRGGLPAAQLHFERSLQLNPSLRPYLAARDLAAEAA